MAMARDALRHISSFPALVSYLRDELGWPIETDDFEELTFDYTPEELGIDAASAAHIDEIKRLRQLSSDQPWGIFFVQFEPQRLPVVALRRILNRVVVKKRASSRAAEQQQWEMDDLIFISSYGDEQERRISFAHFSRPERDGGLPILKVLAWDERDTGLHLDDVAARLAEFLSWPTDDKEGQQDAWRQRWRSAFELREREVVTTSRGLAIRLAELARAVRVRINEILSIEGRDGPVSKLKVAFQEAMVHGLSDDGFADMYAQTIAYGLLSARIADPTRSTTAEHLPVTNPFLKELMATFLDAGIGSADTRIDFDELGVSDVVQLLDSANMDAVLRDFGDANPREDPVVHFYELFIKEYDAARKVQRGVFYTPRPAVSYIVRRVHEALQDEFLLADGLADTSSWGDVAARVGLSVPAGVSEAQPFVCLLDPATGTGTFLVEVIDVVHRHMRDKWEAEGATASQVLERWNEYVPRSLLPRLHGYELMMAPYAIAHLKVGLKLLETGYRFGSTERARIYLTNALEPSQEMSDQLELTAPALAHEAHAVNRVKATARFTVVVGNPPYSSSKTVNPWITELMDEWKRGLNETKVDVMREEWKFLRLAQVLTAAGGVASYVINRDFLDGVTKRRLRESLEETFPLRRVVDLNGDVKGEVSDENVFEIMQGVCVVTLGSAPCSEAHTYVSLEGSREGKYEWLERGADEGVTPHLSSAPLFKWSPQRSDDGGAEYDAWLPLSEVFRVYSSGIQTQRDGVCIAPDGDALWERVELIVAESAEEARGLLDTGPDGTDWKLDWAKADLLASGPDRRYVTRVLYRPFDVRFTYWTGKTKGFHARPRRDVMRHMVGRDNIGLLFNRQIVGERVSHFGVSRLPTCWGVFYLGNKGSDYLAPLNLFGEEGTLESDTRAEPNLSHEWLSRIAAMGAGAAVPTSDHLAYLYAVLSSAAYRKRYAGRLKEDFARVPVPATPALFAELVAVGRRLVALHADCEVPGGRCAQYAGPETPSVSSIVWLDDTVWLDGTSATKRRAAAPGTAGFSGVSQSVWEFEFGGYQVCEKWLKDRKGRTLSREELDHYLTVVAVIEETLRLVEEIDRVISVHGGWPEAFSGAETS